jgi:hypothetical protein
MMQCLDGLKHLALILLTCCDADPPKVRQNPKDVARGTVCMCLPLHLLLLFLFVTTPTMALCTKCSYSE